MSALPRVKEPHLAGRSYPAAPDALAAEVARLLAAAGTSGAGGRALLVPHAPWGEAGATAARGFAAVATLRPERTVVLAPSHLATFRGAAVLPMEGYRTPLGVARLDTAGAEALAVSPLVRPNPALFLREHAIEVQLPWLQTVAPRCAVLPVLVGTLEAGEAEALAAALAPLAGPGVLLVASSDLVHYGRRYAFEPVPASDASTVASAVHGLDEAALAHIEGRDPAGFGRWVAASGASICGRAAIEVMLHVLPADVRGERLAHATSLDATGVWDHVVGYAAVVFR